MLTVSGAQTLLVVGQSTNSTNNGLTLLLDVESNTWRRGAPRLCFGDHMASAVLDNKLYLVGGFASYCSTCLIWRSLYYCGGVKNATLATSSNVPVSSCARYDVDEGTWTLIASMPAGVHHAAAGTDGARMFVFGGRQSAGRGLGKDVNFTQVYDPATNTWSSSTRGQLSPLPVARGGMGAAAYLGGLFYVMGGETSCGTITPCPNPATGLTVDGVYSRVDRSSSAGIFVCGGATGAKTGGPVDLCDLTVAPYLDA
ncbi:hypothetical protein HYH02_008790 [Chlamydomonas schloesseri]|uniref:Uncharacterized protein n=1 Tax=Chlamydomonas schloesseri TaxID=2026947 RepID=A0A835WDK4_9CHLO|nr:hypothetical protein HYH02_008790 [Chlamydomonas schloesseri]|eukprot:KAG2445324.1 hypothetical protein HYH02_008790 [Chlamydomonas schloesseri]